MLSDVRWHIADLYDTMPCSNIYGRESQFSVVAGPGFVPGWMQAKRESC